MVVVAFSVGMFINFEKTEIKIEVVTLVEESERCKRQGGTLWIFPQYSSDNFPEYEGYCKKETSEELFEFKL